MWMYTHGVLTALIKSIWFCLSLRSSDAFAPCWIDRGGYRLCCRFIPRGKLINDVLDPIQDARLCLYENYGSSYLELIHLYKPHGTN